MTAPKLFPPRNAIGPHERAAILECMNHYRLREEDFPYGGEFCQRYVRALCAYFGTKHALAISSGTSALFVAIRALDLPAGSTVLCSPITDPGCVSAITMNGLKLGLVDCAPNSFSMDAGLIEKSLTPDVSAVLFVHAAGHATDLSRLRQQLDRKGAFLIEDVSQAHGARVGTTMAGQFGHISALSTMYRKAHVTGSNGGVILTDSAELYRKAVMRADRGKDKGSSHHDDRNPINYALPDLNFNLDEISCAIGCASLARLDDTRNRRLAFVQRVTERIAKTDNGFEVFPFTAGDSPFLIPVRCPPDIVAEGKTAFATRLRDRGVPLNPHYEYVVSDWNYGRALGLSSDALPNTKRAQNEHFLLYVNENYGTAEADFAVERLTELLHSRPAAKAAVKRLAAT